MISLKSEISRSDLVLNFFIVNEEDLAMHTDETLWAKNESEQVKYSSDISNPIKAQEYKVERTYKAKSKSEVSVSKDTTVTVIEKSLSGWWLINTSNGDQGMEKNCLIKTFSPIIRILNFLGYVPYNILEVKDSLNMIKLEKGLLNFYFLRINFILRYMT